MTDTPRTLRSYCTLTARHLSVFVLGLLCTNCTIEVEAEPTLEFEPIEADDANTGTSIGVDPSAGFTTGVAGMTGTGGLTQPAGTDSTSATQSSDQSSTTSTVAPPQPPHLQYMVITPGDQMVQLDLATEQTLSYQVIGYFSDGHKEDLSAQATWSISEPGVGSFNSAQLALAPHSELYVQTAKVQASFDSVQAQAQLTVAAFEQSGDNPDFLFVLPYQDPAGAQEQSLAFETEIPAMDVFFSVDATGSMRNERDALLASIESTIVPAVQTKIPDTQFGVGSMQDFPIAPNGTSQDQPFRLFQTITDDIDAVKAGVASIEIGHGNDNPESILEAMHQIATGEGLSGPGATLVPPNHEGVGGVDFREGAMPVIVSMTDAPSHVNGESSSPCGLDYDEQVQSVAHTRQETHDALQNICARVITVASQGSHSSNPECQPAHDGTLLADATKAKVSPLAWQGARPAGCQEGECCTGINGRGQAPDAQGMCPLVFHVNARGEGLDESVVSGLEALAYYAPFDVTTESSGNQVSDQGMVLPNNLDASAFIQSISATHVSKLPRPDLNPPVPSGDHFKAVIPGTQVHFSIQARNDVLPQGAKAQVFRAKIRVKADQCESIGLDEREVVFVIPPRALVAG